MLTSLANVKSFLGITDSTYDAQLTTLIAGVDEQVKRYCARNFEQGTVIAKLTVDRSNPIVLDETPVQAILFAGAGQLEAITLSHPSERASAFITTERNGLSTLKLVAGMTAAVISPAIDDTLADLVADVVAAGWNADVETSLQDYPAHCLLDQETGDGDTDENLVLYGALTPVRLRREAAAGIYQLGFPSSIYSCFPSNSDPIWLRENDQRWRDADRDNLPLVVVYTGGYAAGSIPAGLVLIVNKCCCDAFRNLGSNAAMKSETVGDYSYDKFQEAQIASAIGPYMSALDLYKRV